MAVITTQPRSLARHWLFDELTEAEVAPILTLAVHRHLPAGTMLFSKGDPTPGLHLVEKGAIRIFTVTAAGAERIVDIIGPGEFCGEMGIVGRAPSAAWGQAIGVTRLWVIPAADCERILSVHPSVCLKVARALAAKLQAASGQMDETLFLSARERVLRHLVRLAERHGRAEGGALRLSLRLTHQELARLVGTSRETVSRVLGELQDRQILRIDQRRLVVADLPALRRLAGLE